MEKVLHNPEAIRSTLRQRLTETPSKETNWPFRDKELLKSTPPAWNKRECLVTWKRSWCARCNQAMSQKTSTGDKSLGTTLTSCSFETQGKIDLLTKYLQHVLILKYIKLQIKMNRHVNNENYYKNLDFALYNHKFYIQTYPCPSLPLKTTTTTTSSQIIHANHSLKLCHPSTGLVTTWATCLPAHAGTELWGFTKSLTMGTLLGSPRKWAWKQKIP